MAFFRHVGPRALRFIAFKAEVLTQARAPRIANPSFIRNLLVTGLADLCGTQKGHPLGGAGHNHYILVGMRFLAHAIMSSLFFGIFRTLAAALRAIDDPLASFGLSPFLPATCGPSRSGV